MRGPFTTNASSPSFGIDVCSSSYSSPSSLIFYLINFDAQIAFGNAHLRGERIDESSDNSLLLIQRAITQLLVHHLHLKSLSQPRFIVCVLHAVSIRVIGRGRSMVTAVRVVPMAVGVIVSTA